MSWTLPDSLDDPAYGEAQEMIAAAPPARAIEMRAQLCEADFYAYLRLISSFGKYVISDEGHPMHGRLWVEHPRVFQMAREIQRVVEEKRDDYFFNWARFHFKTQLITQDATLWELTRDPSLTFAIITHKTDQVGMQIFSGIRAEATENPELQRHWPHIFAPSEALPLNTNTAFTLLREPGPREPTVSIHPLDNLPAGGHYRRIKVDDAVVAKSVDTPGAISRTLRQMRRIGPLAQDDTITTWIGTIWAPDDPYMICLRSASEEDRLFTGRSLLTAYEHLEGLAWTATSDPDEWEPTLHSRDFLKRWHRKLGPYDFAAQMQQTTIAKSEQGFDKSWVSYYQKPPRLEGGGGDPNASAQIILLVDAAGGDETKDGDDFWVFRVYRLGADERLYALDLWRENLSLDEALTLTFALVKFWKPKATYTEDYGQTMLIPAIQREQEAQGYRFPIERFPAIKRPKEARISLLQPEYRAGRFLYPADGFGHGSGPKYVDQLVRAAGIKVLKMRDRIRDARDTMTQFFDDELTRWVPRKKSIPHDDCLDLEAWTVQPEVWLPYPQSDTSVPEYNRIPESHGGRDVETAYANVGYWGL